MQRGNELSATHNALQHMGIGANHSYIPARVSHENDNVRLAIIRRTLEGRSALTSHFAFEDGVIQPPIAGDSCCRNVCFTKHVVCGKPKSSLTSEREHALMFTQDTISSQANTVSSGHAHAQRPCLWALGRTLLLVLQGKRIVAFVIGGMTRSEMRVAHKLSSKLGREVLLGSTSCDTPTTFLKSLQVTVLHGMACLFSPTHEI